MMRVLFTILFFLPGIFLPAQTQMRGNVNACWCHDSTPVNGAGVAMAFSDTAITETYYTDAKGDFPFSLSVEYRMVDFIFSFHDSQLIPVCIDCDSLQNYKVCLLSDTGDSTRYYWEHVQRYANGGVYMRGLLLKGKREGDWQVFYEDGKPWSKGTYRNGLRQGYGVSYYANGKKSTEGYYKDDKMVGKWKYWDAEGTLAEKDYGGL